MELLTPVMENNSSIRFPLDAEALLRSKKSNLQQRFYYHTKMSGQKKDDKKSRIPETLLSSQHEISGSETYLIFC